MTWYLKMVVENVYLKAIKDSQEIPFFLDSDFCSEILFPHIINCMSFLTFYLYISKPTDKLT